jgi:hypothetical protein
MRTFYSLKGFNLPTELRLVLSCLRVKPTEKEVQQIDELSRTQIDWPNFLRWVDRHRVAPLVYQNLRRYGGSRVQDSAMSALRSRFESNARRGLGNTVEVVGLSKLFQENGVASIPLKGSVLALQIYGDLALRHAGDIDILVDPSQVELSDRLIQINYSRIMPGFRLSPAQHRRFLRLIHHFEYLHDQGNLRVELHWRSTHNQPPRGMDLTGLRSRASTVVVAGYRLPAISLPDNFLYLCAHGADHFWHRLFWLVDLTEIIRGNAEIDWPRLMTFASEVGMMRPLALGVLLAHELLDVPLPEVIRTYILKDQIVSIAAQLAYQSMLCLQPERPPISLSLKRNVYLLRCAHSFGERLNTLQKIFAGHYWKNGRIPDPLFCLYYLLRFASWLRRRL